jgi:hypothetical protein
MNFAFLLRSSAFISLQSIACRFIAGYRDSQAPLTHSGIHRFVENTALRANMPMVHPCLQVRRPLRVVRVLESGQPLSHVGRMVISGHMADVCAELDRLAAREAADNCGLSGGPVTSCLKV